MVLIPLFNGGLTVLRLFTGEVFIVFGFLKTERRVFAPTTTTTHDKNITKSEINPKKGEVAVIIHLAIILTRKNQGFL